MTRSDVAEQALTPRHLPGPPWDPGMTRCGKVMPGVNGTGPTCLECHFIKKLAYALSYGGQSFPFDLEIK